MSKMSTCYRIWSNELYNLLFHIELFVNNGSHKQNHLKMTADFEERSDSEKNTIY
jgi:hypothetical protein